MRKNIFMTSLILLVLIPVNSPLFGGDYSKEKVIFEDDFNDLSLWRISGIKNEKRVETVKGQTFLPSLDIRYKGHPSASLSYNFTTEGEDSVLITRSLPDVSVTPLRSVPPGVSDISVTKKSRIELSVFADKNWHRLFLVVKEKSGERHFFNMGKIRWKGWKELTLTLADSSAASPSAAIAHWGGNDNLLLEFPITEISIGVSDVCDRFNGRGRIYLGELRIVEQEKGSEQIVEDLLKGGVEDNIEEMMESSDAIMKEISVGNGSEIVPEEDLRLLCYWAYDEGEGETIRDTSIYGRLYGIVGGISACAWEKGIKGSCLEFNGKNSSLPIGDRGVRTWFDSSEFTFEGWFYTYGKASRQGIITSSSPRTWNSFNVYLKGSYLAGHVGRETIYVPISLNTWHHFALVYDKADESRTNKGRMKLYLDGQLRKEKAVKPFGHNPPHSIGRGRLRSGHIFHGMLDEIRIYDEALSSKEINEHFKRDQGSKVNTQ